MRRASFDVRRLSENLNTCEHQRDMKHLFVKRSPTLYCFFSLSLSWFFHRPLDNRFWNFSHFYALHFQLVFDTHLPYSDFWYYHARIAAEQTKTAFRHRFLFAKNFSSNWINSLVCHKQILRVSRGANVANASRTLTADLIYSICCCSSIAYRIRIANLNAHWCAYMYNGCFTLWGFRRRKHTHTRTSLALSHIQRQSSLSLYRQCKQQ